MITQPPRAGFVRTRPANTGLTPTLDHYKERMVVVVVALAWLVLAVCGALVVAAGIRQADRHAPSTDHLIGLPAELTVDDVLGVRTAQPSR